MTPLQALPDLSALNNLPQGLQLLLGLPITALCIIGWLMSQRGKVTPAPAPQPAPPIMEFYDGPIMHFLKIAERGVAALEKLPVSLQDIQKMADHLRETRQLMRDEMDHMGTRQDAEMEKIEKEMREEMRLIYERLRVVGEGLAALQGMRRRQ